MFQPARFTDPRSEPPPSLPASPEVICQFVASCVAADFNLDAVALTAATRGSPRVAFARQVAMYLAHVGFALSFEMIGRCFGRDRTTVAHACRVVEDGRDDIWLDCRLATLERVCRADVTGSREAER
ncbi:MAG: DNA replication initiation protein [Rhodopseudomonas sp.]|uniref:helix-turn-helix domain-containing protein n=1 Tax=Rhodopseudomonas sp. TaxID=1078 RepID=UPI001802AF17|nr:helix-turn-helix domain-containing protein [Rhodopseudomonas sp.]NVN87057.1 DNA replication initiation protein [Rhodopseudomonas sp.]